MRTQNRKIVDASEFLETIEKTNNFKISFSEDSIPVCQGCGFLIKFEPSTISRYPEMQATPKHSSIFLVNALDFAE